jgi:opacity protein-like surface antigen
LKSHRYFNVKASLENIYIRNYNMLKRIAFIVLLIAASSTVLAQYDNQKKQRSQSPSGSRNGRFETSVILAYQTSTDKASEGGSELDIDSTVGWGFTIGWNWTEKLNVAYRLTSTGPKYLATIVPEDELLDPQTIEHKMSKYSHQLNLTYNFSGKAFTPFIQGGLGMASVDSNVPTGGVDGGCWWDPWWGYICFADWETYSTREFSYNLGLGARWDINTALFTRAAYSMEFVNAKNGTLNFGTAILELGLMF